MKIKKIILLNLFFIIYLALFAFDLPVSSNNIPLIMVSVTGAIKNPGVYKIPLHSRLSVAIKKSEYVPKDINPIILTGNTNSKVDNKNNDKQTLNPSYRNISILRENNKIVADLKKFYQLGDLKNNPYLQDGDVIFVPAVKNVVSISGEINSPNKYEILVGDKLSDIIELAMGLKNSAFLDSVYVFRYTKDHTHFERIIVNYNKVLANRDSQENITLQDGDRIFIRPIPNFHLQNTVEIDGEIKFPGTYPIEKSKTTLLDILTKSGSPTDFADLHNALLIRIPENSEFAYDAEYQRLKLIPISDMNYDEYEYFKAKSRLLNGFIDVDFYKLWTTKDAKYDVLLKNGDKIYIPNKKLTVEVLGQVKNPGKYTYIKGKDYFYYIMQANGFGLRANKRKIKIIKYKSGTWEKPKNTVIEPGDKIFIPEKPRYDYVKITKDVLQILTSAATLYFMRNSFK